MVGVWWMEHFWEVCVRGYYDRGVRDYYDRD